MEMGCCNSTVLSAPIDDVWPVLRDFHDMSWASMIESLEKVGDTGGTEAGAKRILNGAFEETLIELDDEGHTVRYSIDNGPVAYHLTTSRDTSGSFRRIR